MLNIVNRHRTAAWVMFSLAWIPPPAYAQVMPCIPNVTCASSDNTPPRVSITSPDSGAAVSGTITVTVTAADDVGIAGVQFLLDGVQSADDTTTPYSLSWDTTTASNGPHTLTAVARDAAGNQTTSAPVTVSTAPPSPAAVQRYEESNASVSFSSFGWDPYGADWLGWSGGTAVSSSLPGAQASFTFTGTSVSWIGYRGNEAGIARVSLDGEFVTEVDLWARSVDIHVPVFTASGLADGTHTLTIEVTGLKNPEADLFRVVVDAFDVPAPVVSRMQDTDPAVTMTAAWTPATDSRMTWSGGSALVSETSGAQVTMAFDGTSISWNGLRSPETGIARLFLDGAFAGEFDTYSPSYRLQGTVYTSPPLADGSHTLTIEATGRHNAASTSAQILVDTFDVVMPGRRLEETDAAVTYTGAWIHNNRNRSWSMASASESLEPGARATFTFTGSSVRWIGLRQNTTGIARVFLDGNFVAEVDTYAPESGPQGTLFTSPPLAEGSHTLMIEVTGRKNPASWNTWIVVDAFDVRP